VLSSRSRETGEPASDFAEPEDGGRFMGERRP
jgi:hypothetical protein